MAEFKANLNPVSNKTDINDLLKMDDYLGRKAKPAKVTATPAATAILAKPALNDIVRSSPDDVGVPFKFGNNNQ